MFDRARRVTHEISETLVQAIVPPFYSRIPGVGRLAWGAKRAPAPAQDEEKGLLLLVGGERLTDDLTVELIHLAGGRNAPVLVLGGGTQDRCHLDCLRRFGMGKLRFFDLTAWSSGGGEAVPAVGDSHVLILAGHDDDGLSRILRETAIGDVVREAHSRGRLVVGIGRAVPFLGDQVLSSCGQSLQKGLGLLPGVVVDERLNGNGRLGRLMSEVRSSDATSLGLALDEGTAAVVYPGNDELRVVGEHSIIIVDGDRRHRLHGDHTKTNLATTDMLVHVLYDGQRFDLMSRRPIVGGR